MRVALAADHAGVALKDQLLAVLAELGVSFRDFGTTGCDPVDYPDFAAAVAAEVAAGRFDTGILVCGSGTGMAMAANKVHGARAAMAPDEERARLARSHNDANILTLGARFTPPDLAARIVRAFLSTPFSAGRHQRRLEKIARLDAGARLDVEGSQP